MPAMVLSRFAEHLALPLERTQALSGPLNRNGKYPATFRQDLSTVSWSEE